MYTNKNKESTASAEHFGEHFEKLGIKGINRDHVRAMVEYETRGLNYFGRTTGSFIGSSVIHEEAGIPGEV